MNIVRAAPVTCIQSPLCSELSGSLPGSGFKSEHLHMLGCEMGSGLSSQEQIVISKCDMLSFHQMVLSQPHGIENYSFSRWFLWFFFSLLISLNLLSEANSICKCCFGCVWTECVDGSRPVRLVCCWHKDTVVNRLAQDQLNGLLGAALPSVS